MLTPVKNYPALLYKQKQHKTLIIADLHLGWEINLAQRGIHVPSQHSTMADRILRLVDTCDIDIVYIIGDVKHSIMVDSAYNWSAIPEFMEKVLTKSKIVIIPGNHDGDIEPILPRDVVVGSVQGTIIQNDSTSVGLIHGHAWPSVDVLNSNLIVMGHSHLSISRKKSVSASSIGRDERVRYAARVPVILRSKLDRVCVQSSMGLEVDEKESKINVIVMPSFNSLISGIPINMENAELQGPFYTNGCLDLLNSEVLSTQGVYLGTVKSLRNKSQRKH